MVQRPDFIPETPPADLEQAVSAMKQSDEVITSNSLFVANGNNYTKEEAERLSTEKANVISVLFSSCDGYIIYGLGDEWHVDYLGKFLTSQEFDAYHNSIRNNIRKQYDGENLGYIEF